MRVERPSRVWTAFWARLLAIAVVLALSKGEALASGRGGTATAAHRGSSARASQNRPHSVTVAKKSSKTSKKTKKKPAKKGKGTSKPAPPVAPRPVDPNRVTFETPDGVELAGSWMPVAGQPDAPAVLLVHAFSRDRREWDPFVPAFREKGLAVLTLDLRGHGESTRKKSGRIQVTPRLLKDPRAFPRDVETACQWLLARTRKAGVAGWQVGANLAVLATANGWAQAGVAISPSTTNLAELSGSRATKPRSTLVIASVGDPGREASARSLVADGEGAKKLIVYPGAEHARTLLEKHQEAADETVAWLARELGAIPPPAPAVPILRVPAVSTLAPVPAGTPAPQSPPVP